MCKRIFVELQNLDRRVLSVVYHAILLPTNTNIIASDAEADKWGAAGGKDGPLKNK